MTTSVAHTLRMAAIAQDFDDADAAADSRAELRGARKRTADLVVENNANIATVRQLQDTLATVEAELIDARVEASDLAGQLTDARDTLTQRDQEIEILNEQLTSARTALGWMVAE